MNRAQHYSAKSPTSSFNLWSTTCAIFLLAKDPDNRQHIPSSPRPAHFQISPVSTQSSISYRMPVQPLPRKPAPTAIEEVLRYGSTSSLSLCDKDEAVLKQSARSWPTAVCARFDHARLHHEPNSRWWRTDPLSLGSPELKRSSPQEILALSAVNSLDGLKSGI